MDFNDTPQEVEFRKKVQAWLKEATKDHVIDIQDMRQAASLEEGLKRAKAWQATKADAGYACIRWPKEYGGQDATAMENVIYGQEEGKYALPQGYFSIGLGMAGPTMMSYASEEQKRELLPRMIRGDDVWCQLFSEPSAGSDLAGLKTMSIKEGDEWTLNGTKVWTSGAHYADYGIIVCRHDKTLPKHMGLTYFFIDMKSPGIRIERIKQISGASNFCEVFFEDVKVPDSQRLGGIGDGWGVALTTLMNERLAVGNPGGPGAASLIDLAKNIDLGNGPAIKDASIREKIADWYIQGQGLRFTAFRTMTALSRGQTPGPEASIGKIVAASNLQDMTSFGMDLMDMGGILLEPDLVPGETMYQEGFLGSPGIRIAGGSDEILRNIIAERVLSLPPDIRIDKKVPFSELPTGTL